MNKKLKAHLFVCTNNRATGESCAAKGSQELRDQLKKEFKGIPGLRINNAGCLGRCEEGIVCVLYPAGKWFTRLSSADKETLVRELRMALEEPGVRS